MTIAFSDEESALLDKIAIDMTLEGLPPLERDLIRCHYTYGDPPGGERYWPRNYTAIGQLLGYVHARRPLSATVVKERGIATHARWIHHYPSHLHTAIMLTPFAAAHTKYTPFIQNIAKKMVKRDPDFVQDLMQEGYLALYRCTPAQWRRVAYCQAIIRSAMRDYWRREWRQSGKIPGTSLDDPQSSHQTAESMDQTAWSDDHE